MAEFLNHPLVAWGAILALIGAGFWAGKMQEHKGTVQKFMQEIRDDIKKILRLLPKAVAAGESPLQLTDLGKSISVAIGAKTWAERTAQNLQAHTKGMQPYEIQEFSFSHVKDFTPTAEQEAKIKSCAYENALKQEKVLDVLALELRDRLLELAGLQAPENDESDLKEA